MNANARTSAARHLEELYENERTRLTRDVRSPEGAFEVQMGMRSKMARHRPTEVRQDLPNDEQTGVLWRDGGLRSGLVATGLGDPGGGTYEMDVDAVQDDMHAVGYFRRVRAGLAVADELGPRRGWLLDVKPSVVLARRYGQFMPRERWPFDPQAKTFATKKAPPLAEGYVLNLVRGPGNLAEYTVAATSAFGGARTRRDLAGWVSWLGKKLNASGKSTEADRQLANQIMEESVTLCWLALSIYIAASRTVGRVPAIVQRRARARP